MTDTTQAALGAALANSSRDAGCAISVIGGAETNWRSVTFTGARRLVTLTCAPGAALDSWIAALPEAELEIPGHLVADAAVLRVGLVGGVVAIDIEVLTVECRAAVREAA